jgi:hypothetical protein
MAEVLCLALAVEGWIGQVEGQSARIQAEDVAILVLSWKRGKRPPTSPSTVSDEQALAPEK